MPALNHVITWDEKTNKWKRITAAEASKQWGGQTVQASSEVFVCELCKQYVILTCDTGKVSAYFKHNRSEEDKSCPEHSFGSHPITYEPKSFALPLKLFVSAKGRLNFSLGLISPGNLTSEDHELLRNSSVTITPRDFHERTVSPISYRLDRLLDRGITYIPAGSTPEEEYVLKVSEKAASILHWPGTTPGVRRSGSLFDSKSGKRIPEDGDVITGKEYYLLKANGRPYAENGDVNCEEIPLTTTTEWRLFKVSASKVSKSAAKFFLQYKLRLTESPVTLFPIWPMTIRRPYTIIYEDPHLIFYSSGSDIDNKVYPADLAQEGRHAKRGNNRLFEVDIKRHGLLITSGRTNVLKYAFVLEEKLPTLSENDDSDLVTIKDSEGKYIDIKSITTNGIDSRKNKIEITAKYEGSIDIEVSGHLVERIKLKPEVSQRVHLPEICDCRIRIGRDEICKFKVRLLHKKANLMVTAAQGLAFKRKLRLQGDRSQYNIAPASGLKIMSVLGRQQVIKEKLKSGRIPQQLIKAFFQRKST